MLSRDITEVGMIDVVWRAIERAKIHLDMCEGMILAHPKELVGLPGGRRSFNCRKFRPLLST